MNKEERALFVELCRCLSQIKNEHPDLYNIKLLLDDILKGRIDWAWKDLAVIYKRAFPHMVGVDEPISITAKKIRRWARRDNP